MNLKLVSAIIFSVTAFSCGDSASTGATEESIVAVQKQKLPFMGEHDVEFVTKASGEKIPDTVYYTVPKFSFINQDSAEVSTRDYEGKIYVTDFFFTTCPSICPIMSKQ